MIICPWCLSPKWKLCYSSMVSPMGDTYLCLNTKCSKAFGAYANTHLHIVHNNGSLTMYTFDKINNLTGFANGSKFSSEEEVRSYFTPERQEEMFGIDAVDEWELLDLLADEVITNRWHCDF